MLTITIGGRTLGDGCPVYVIAEAGSNHNGSLDQARQLIDVAVEAKADAVKFQLFKASRLYPTSAGQSDYLHDPKSIYEIIREMEMPPEWVPRLADHCRACGIEFLCTPFDEDAADFLNPYVRAFKIASYEMTHTPLLRHVARFGKPIILSTGAADLAEVQAAVAAVHGEGNRNLVLLQCTASYPARPEALNVAAMGQLRASTGLLVGLSDHSRDPVIAPAVATALGAAVIEKHFTLSNDLPGPDHGFALEPPELKQMVDAVRLASMVTGSAVKKVIDDERELYQFARRCVFSTRAIAAGEALSADNVAVLRCGKRGVGVPPAAYPDVLGRIAARAIPPETPITADALT